MNREQIDAAATDYASDDNYASFSEVEKAFVAGAEFAIRWSDITPEAPANYEVVILRGDDHQWFGARREGVWYEGLPVWSNLSQSWKLDEYAETHDDQIPTHYRPLPGLEDGT